MTTKKELLIELHSDIAKIWRDGRQYYIEKPCVTGKKDYELDGYNKAMDIVLKTIENFYRREKESIALAIRSRPKLDNLTKEMLK